MPSFSSPVDHARLFYRYCKPDESAFKPLERKTSDVTLVFLHGWPMSSRMYEHLIVPLCETYRFTCLAPNRRGFGKSDWNSDKTDKTITYDTFAADFIQLITILDVKHFVFVASSLGAAEGVLAYLASDLVQERCKGFFLMGPSMPFPCQTPGQPLGPPAEIWESILDGLRADRPQFVSDSLPGIFAMQAGNQVSAKTLETFERIVAEADTLAVEKTASIIIKKTMDTELRKLATVPEERRPAVMILHGDADQGMPLEASSQVIKDILPWTDLRVYEKAGHGLYVTHAGQVIHDLIEFVDKLG